MDFFIALFVCFRVYLRHFMVVAIPALVIIDAHSHPGGAAWSVRKCSRSIFLWVSLALIMLPSGLTAEVPFARRQG